MLNDTKKVAKSLATIDLEIYRSAKFLYEINRQVGTKPPGWSIWEYYESAFKQAEREKKVLQNPEARGVPIRDSEASRLRRNKSKSKTR